MISSGNWTYYKTSATAARGTADVPKRLLDPQVARRFSVDIHPRFVLARGGMVDLLVRSEVSNYTVRRVLSPLFPPPPPHIFAIAEPY